MLQKLRRPFSKSHSPARRDTGVVASSANGSGSDVPHKERSGNSSAAPVPGTQPPLPPPLSLSPARINQPLSPHTKPSLWDRAYDALRENEAKLVAKYEELLLKEVKMANSALHDHPDDQSRQAQLDTVIAQGLRRIDEKKVRYTIAGREFNLTEQIGQVEGLVLWAKDWIGEAVKASPEASVAWAGICAILPLLTNPRTAEDARRDGFTYVTTRMRYYTALEPLLARLGQNANAGVADAVLTETNNHLVVLYTDVLSFQIQSVLRFYESHLRGYASDIFSVNWKQMRLDIENRDAVVRADLNQINAFVAREELESLSKKSSESLNAVEQLLTVSRRQLDVLVEIQKDTAQQRLLKCLQLFRLTNNDKDVTYEWYKDRVKDRVDDTCLWFLQHGHFREWSELESGPLLVSADPGCGKSVLAKHLVDHELPKLSAAADTKVYYFFFQDQDQNTARQALCALLHQLFSHNPALIKHAMKPFDNEGAGLIHSTKSLWTIFNHTVRDPQAGPITVVLDALDECAEPEREDLLRNIKSQFSSGNDQPTLKFLMTSRPYEPIVSKFGDFPHVRIRGEEESDIISTEVNRVIQHRVEQLAREKTLPDPLKRRLEEKLLSIRHRTYLWVYLVFDYLEAQDFRRTVKGVNEAIDKLPTSVNMAYEKILNKSENVPFVQRVLRIVLAAARPLTLTEMNISLSVDEVYENDSVSDSNSSTDAARLPPHSTDALDPEDDSDFERHLRSWCGLFVSVDHGSIYFLHQTAREFLLRTNLSPPPAAAVSSPERCWMHSIAPRDASAVLAEICVRYLYLFNSPGSPRRHALLDYAAEYWSSHFSQADFEDGAPIVPFAAAICDEHGRSYRAWYDIYRGGAADAPWDGASLAVAAFFGHSSVVRLLLRRCGGGSGGALEDREMQTGRTPLSWAADGGHEAVVQRLLEAGAIVDAKDNDGRTPLWLAADKGHEAVVRRLLEAGAAVDAKDNYGQTLLWRAAFSGYEAVVRRLLEAGAAVDTKDKSGQTPLWWAAYNGHDAIVQQFLDAGAAVDTQDKYGRTPLWWAEREGHEAVVQLLLKASHGVDIKDNKS